MIKWKPDTCDCIIIYNQNINWVETIQTCRLHRQLRGQNLLNDVIAQNRRFNSAHGLTPTEDEMDDLSNAKSVNKRRIRSENLDNFHEHLPDHHPPSFFENLKNILRRRGPP